VTVEAGPLAALRASFPGYRIRRGVSSYLAEARPAVPATRQPSAARRPARPTGPARPRRERRTPVRLRRVGSVPDAMKPAIHSVRTHWIPGFMAFPAGPARPIVMLTVSV
jgi:hypothetical protein